MYVLDEHDVLAINTPDFKKVYGAILELLKAFFSENGGNNYVH